MVAKTDVGRNIIHNRRVKLATSKGLALTKTAVVIIVDGNVEKAYFNKLNSLGIFPNLRFKPMIGNDITYLNILKENFDISYKYLILDIDCCDKSNGSRTTRIRKILSKSDTKGITFFNNYSFETFLLNHVYPFRTPITAKNQYDSFMNKHFQVESWSNNKNGANTERIILQIDEQSFNAMLNNLKGMYQKDCFITPNSSMLMLFDLLNKIEGS